MKLDHDRRSAANILEALTAESASHGRVGVDVVDVAEWKQCLDAAGEALLGKIYTEGELTFSEGRVERLATRLAAKEAVLKLLGTGMRGVSARDIEVVSRESGEPTIRLTGSAELVALELGVSSIQISLCHEAGLAFAVALSTEEGEKFDE